MGDDFPSESGGIDLDFGDVEPQTFEPIPEGVYKLKVDGVPKKKLTANGNDQISVMFRVTEPDEFSGKVVWDNWMLLPQSRWVIQAALEALTGEKWREDSMKLDLMDLPGLEATAVVVIDTYQGKRRNKISRWLSTDEAENTGGSSGAPYEPPF